VNTPEPSVTPRRITLPDSFKDSLSKAKKESVSELRYVEAPQRSHVAGKGHLLGGIALLLTASALIVTGTLMDGPRVLVPLFTGLACFVALWVLARWRILRQRNGGFFALGVISLVAALVSMGQSGYEKLQHHLTPAELDADGGDQVVEVQKEQRPQKGSKPGGSEQAIPLLSQEFGVQQPRPGEEKVVTVLQESQVKAGRKIYRVKAGEKFPLVEERDGAVYFAANEIRVSLPNAKVEVSGGRPPEPTVAVRPAAPEPEPETPAQVTQRAQREAMRRYPALAVRGSAENELFVNTYNELKVVGSEVLNDPEWPLDIAESLAKRNGWRAVDDPAPAGDAVRQLGAPEIPAPQLAPPSNAAPEVPPQVIPE
jgi:hypothetical protein